MAAKLFMSTLFRINGQGGMLHNYGKTATRSCQGSRIHNRSFLYGNNDKANSIKQMRIIIVSGMHRSGTSCVAGELAAVGFGISEDLIPADSANVKGYFEDRQIVALHDEILARFGSNWMDPSPLRQVEDLSELNIEYAKRFDACIGAMKSDDNTVIVKDPRICRLWPFVLAAAAAKGHEIYNIHVVRSCAEVASSLWKRNNLPAPHAFQLWARYNMDAMDHVRDIASATVSYRQVVADNSVLPGALLKLGLMAPNPDNFGAFASRDLMHGINEHDDAPYHRDDFPLPVYENEADFTYDNMKTLYDQCGGDLAAKERRHYSVIHSTLWTVVEETRASEKRIESLQAEINAAQASFAAAQAEIEAAHTKNHLAQAEITAAQAEITAAHADMVAKQAEIDALQATVKTLQSGIAGNVASIIRTCGRWFNK